jgi:glycosyltransferase involved in cell wall biosynthesis
MRLSIGSFADMSLAPKLTFIVLSYNYADLIGHTIRSILCQTVQDFEIVVVDDASTDRSCDVVRSFADSRIKLLVNERNLGGAGSYNRAVQAARGEYLVNLDADDWITPDKCEKQLAFLAGNKVAVLGSYANFVDREGRPASHTAELEAHLNRQFDLNAVDTWIGHNRLVRSSTMVERAAHQGVGLDDPSMVRAPDYELWTRFLRAGYRFAVLPERLLFYRAHPGGVTHADPRGVFLEMSYSTLRNLVPLIEQKALWPSLCRIMEAWIENGMFAALSPFERYRLLGMLMGRPQFANFASFRAAVETSGKHEDLLVTSGRRLLALVNGLRDKRRPDFAAVSEAPDFWHRTSERWEAAANEAEARAASAIAAASDAEARATSAELPLFSVGGLRTVYRGLMRRAADRLKLRRVRLPSRSQRDAPPPSQR